MALGMPLHIPISRTRDDLTHNGYCGDGGCGKSNFNYITIIKIKS